MSKQLPKQYKQTHKLWQTSSKRTKQLPQQYETMIKQSPTQYKQITNKWQTQNTTKQSPTQYTRTHKYITCPNNHYNNAKSNNNMIKTKTAKSTQQSPTP